MNYVSIVREYQNRLNFHAKTGGLLDGLTIKKSGEFRIDGTSDLPQFTLIDPAINDERGTSTGTISAFLRTKRKNDWAKLTDDGDPGLLDWVELVMDAMETRPSDGAPDQLMTMHNADGTLMLVNGTDYQLLIDPWKWTCRMAEINEGGFTYQMDLSFALPQNKRGSRRKTPFAPS